MFWQLFRESIIMQACLSTIITITICSMYATGREVPIELISAWMLSLGFFFGTKVQHTIERANRKVRGDEE